MSQATPMLNVDRWAGYTKQNLHQQGNHIKEMSRYYGPWLERTTPKQNKRMWKKMLKNGDTSIAIRRNPKVTRVWSYLD